MPGDQYIITKYTIHAAAGPHLWNSFPVQLFNPDITYGLFKWQLTGHHLQEAWTQHSVTS